MNLRDYIDNARGGAEDEEPPGAERYTPAGEHIPLSDWTEVDRAIALSPRLTQGEASKIMGTPVWRVKQARIRWRS